MNTIWKYVLEPQITLDMPAGATILSVGAQGDDICLWARVDTDAPAEPRRFLVAGTGMPLSESFNGARFIGTVQMTLAGVSLVMHVFEAEV
ncbi:hypothetical protein LLL46_003594 [Salmonella enterica subsp. enterica serovar Saintpaul]|nr:hypothetical protein [Salmonella enterica subsp. enterica serovar Saintpaul]